MKIKDCSVLIVEDEFIASEYLTQILLSFRAKYIFKASSAKEALTIAQNNPIDLAFMDINIQGGIDGIECASLLNKICFIPIIFTTAYGDTNTINEAKEENIFGYLVKPFQPNDIEAALHVALSTIKRMKELTNSSATSEIHVKSINLGEEYCYHLQSKTLTFCNTPINLTKKELEVLDILCKNTNKNISYAHLKEVVWSEKEISDSTIRDTVSRLKKKISHVNIENISNYGYVLKMG